MDKRFNRPLIMRRKAASYVKIALLAIPALILVLFLWVQTGLGLNNIIENVLNGSGALGDATLEIGGIRGNLFRSLTADEIRLINTSDQDLVQIEKVKLDYALLKILTGSIFLPEVSITSPQIHMSQQSDGSWDLANVFQTNTPQTKNEESTTNIRLDQVTISNLNVVATCYSPQRDSTYNLSNFFLNAGNIRIADSYEGAINNLNGAIHLPGRADSVSLLLKASFDNQLFELDEFQIQSLESDLFGSGTIVFPWKDSLVHMNKFGLQARPLAFDDIRIFAPTLTPGHSMDLMVAIQGDSEGLSSTASIDISDGSSLLLEGVLTGLEQNDVNLDLETTISKFNPALLNQEGLPEGDISLLLSTVLSGNEIERMSGRTSAFLVESTINDIPIDSTSLHIVWQEGEADFDLITEFNNTSFSMEGSALPFATPIQYDVEGTANDINLSTFLDSSYTGIISANWQIEGSGTSPDEAQLESTINVLPSTINEAKVQSGVLSASLSSGTLQIDTNVDTDQGSLRLSSLASIVDEVNIDSLTAELSTLDVTAFIGDTTNSSISGIITANARLGSDMFADWEVDLQDVQYGLYQVQKSTIKGRLANERIRITTENTLGAGSLNFRAAVEPFDEEFSFALEGGNFSNLDIGLFTQEDVLHSSLNGKFEIQGSGQSPSSLTTSGALEILPSQFNEQIIDDGALTFNLSGDTLSTQFALATPGGGFRFGGSVTSLTTSPVYVLNRGEFKDINIGAFTGDSSLVSSLSGNIQLRGRGTNPNEMQVDAELNLRPGSINDAEINDANATLELNSGTGSLRSLVDLEEGKITLDADIESTDEELTYSYQAIVNQLDVGKLLGQDSLQASLNVSLAGNGRDSNPRTMYLTGTLLSDSSNYNDFIVEDAVLDFTMDQGLLQIDTLNVISNVASITGEGPIAIFDDQESLASDFTAVATLEDLSPVGNSMNTELLSVSSGKIDINITGPPGVLQFDSRIDVTGLLYEEYRIGTFDARISGEANADRTIGATVIDGRIRTASIPGFVLDEILYNATLVNEQIDFNIDTRIDSERNAQLVGRATLTDETQLLELSRFNLKVG